MPLHRPKSKTRSGSRPTLSPLRRWRNDPRGERAAGTREPGKGPAGPGSCVLLGPLSFVDGGGRWAAMSVDDGDPAGRRLVGSTVTLDLAGASLGVPDRNADGVISARDLVPGDVVSVTTRLSRASGGAAPLLAVRRMTAGVAAAPA